MAKKRKKRSRMEKILKMREEKAKMALFFARVYDLVRGGNPFGLGEYTLLMARGPDRD